MTFEGSLKVTNGTVILSEFRVLIASGDCEGKRSINKGNNCSQELHLHCILCQKLLVKNVFL